MAFSVDHSQAGGSLIPEGTYEVIIKSPGEDHTKNGTYHISVPLVVRNDVEQPSKNKRIWHQLWQKKEQTEASKACGGFVPQQIHSLSKAAGLPNGKQYESLEDWCKDLDGKLLLATVKHEEYNGYTNAKVAFFNPTKYSNCQHVFKATEVPESSAPNAFVEIDDNGDLPF